MDRNRWWQISLAGSYTVEASYIFSIMLCVIMGVTILGFSIYREGASYIIEETVPEHRDSDELFRRIEWGKDAMESLTGRR